MKSILLITVDCLRPDHMSCYGYNRKTTPLLDKLSTNFKIFDNAFSTGPSTPYSFPAIFTSTHPLDYSSIPSLKHNRRTSLTSIFKEHGYTTAGFHSNVYVSDHYGYERGFDFFFDLGARKGKSKLNTQDKSKVKPPKHSFLKRNIKKVPFLRKILRKIILTFKSVYNQIFVEDEIPYARADVTTEKVLEWLETHHTDQPIFLWVHYMDPHHPFIYSDSLKKWRDEEVSLKKSFKIDKKIRHPENVSEELKQRIIDLYDAEIHFTDKHINKLIKTWQEKIGASTIIITADHGEEFKEHGDFSHKAKLYDELIHVPLLISDNDIDLQRHTDLISLVDLAPTILGLSGIKIPELFKGQFIFGDGYRERPYIISETMEDRGKVSMSGTGNQIVTIRGKRWKYIKYDDGTKQLFNLTEDPMEQNNQIDKKAELAQELEKLIDIHKKKQKLSK